MLPYMCEHAQHTRLKVQAHRSCADAGRLSAAAYHRSVGTEAPVTFSAPDRSPAIPDDAHDTQAAAKALEMAVPTAVHALNTAEEVSAASADVLLQQVCTVSSSADALLSWGHLHKHGRC